MGGASRLAGGAVSGEAENGGVGGAQGSFVSRLTLLWITGLLTLGTGAALGTLDVALQTEASPYGIVSFEFAGTAARAHEMIDSWGPEGRVTAGLILGLDYLYLVAYSSFLLLAGLALSDRLRPRYARYSATLRLFALAMPLAGALDAVENFGSIRLLQGAQSDAWASLAAVCATPKFVIVLGTLALLAVGIVLDRIGGSKASALGE
jgi:hypothetical protein